MKQITKKLLLLFILATAPFLALSQKAVEDTAEVNKAFGLLNAVKKADRFISMLDSSYVIDLPIGIGVKDNKKAESYAIIISELKVREGKTFLTAYMAFTVPGTTKKVAFRGKDIPFSFEGGFEGPVKLDLVSDFDVKLSKTSSLILKGGGRTYVTCDCNGFKEMQLDADLVFDSTMFVAENPDGTLKKNSALRTNIVTTITDWDDLMISISLEPFQLKGLDGVGFSITSATLDLSDKKNPQGIVFTPKHQNTCFIDGAPEIWQGLYIKDARVRLPMQFRKKSAAELTADTVAYRKDTTGTYVIRDSIAFGRLNFFAQNLLIDELGFTAKLGVSNLMTLDEGDLSGWAFSVENLLIDIQASHLVAGSFSGQINVPAFSQNSLFNYNAVIGLNDTYSFRVATTEEVKMSLWVANLKLAPNSALTIALKNKEFIPSLLLNGELSINAPVEKRDSTGKKLSILEIPFQGMKIQTVEPYFSVDKISFGTSQNKFSKFPVSINHIGFVSKPDRYGITIGVKVNFTSETDGGFGGNGKFTVWGKKENDKWGYDGIDITSIAINISKNKAFSFRGEINFFKADSLEGDTTYGNGFRGSIKASFGPSDSTKGIEAIILFGNVNGYRYWFADAMLSIPTGITFGPVAFLGFGGGAWYHMKQIGVGDVPTSKLGESISGIIYKPDESSGFGVKASIKFGLSGSSKAFNGDLSFAISFTTSGGLNQISMVGNGYFATSNFLASASGLLENAKNMMNKTQGEIQLPKDESSSQISGSVSILFDFPNECFHTTFNVDVNVAGGLVTGVGPGGRAGWGVMHFGKDTWYIHMGTPDNPNGISVLGIAKMTNYFMVGESVPEMQPPPIQVLRSLGQNGKDYPMERNEFALQEGGGFAFGAGLSFDTGERTFLIFYGRFGCGIGFDILLKDYGNTTCQGRQGPIGVNGWYAQGQSWAWVAAALGIKVDLPFYSGRYAIFEMDVAALMQVKAPNPFWMKANVGGNYNILNGLVKGHCDFQFEIGEQCQMVSSSPFGGMPAISDIKPTDTETDVSVFTTPQFIFNMPIGETIEFKNENGEQKQFRITMETLEVKTSDGQTIEGSLTWNKRNDVLVFKQKNILPGKSTIKASVGVVFEEYINGAWFKVYQNGQIAREYKEATFTTGEEPTTVEQSNVAYSYPCFRAFNYYQAETNGNYIKLDIGQPKLFQPGAEWVQKAKLTPVLGGQSKYYSYTYNNADNQINLNLPQDMVNNKVYRLELVNLPANSVTAVDENVGSNTSNQVFESEGYTANVEVTTQNAEANRTELQENVIYGMEFRTSNYNTFIQKMDALNSSNGISWELYPLVHSLTVNMNGERFDDYEVMNLKEGTLVSCEILLAETDWYKNYIAPVIELSPANLALVGAQKFQMPALGSYIFQSNGTRSLTEDEATTGLVSEVVVFSGLKNYIAKYTCDYLYLLKNEIAKTYPNGGVPAGQLANLYNANFTPLKYGNYPVNVKYTLPGHDSPNSIDKHVVKFLD